MNDFKKLLKSFVYAFRGIAHCIKTERNLRIHLVFLTYMFGILTLTDWFILSRTDYAVLTLACSTVVAAEIINSAVENAVNLAREEYSDYGRISKDAAAGAVLVCAIFAIITGVIILFQPTAFSLMYNYFKENLLMLLLFTLSLIPAVIFIFRGIPFTKGK